MEIPALISLSAVVKHPPSTVGERAVVLAELVKAGVPVADTQIITTETLHTLSTETKLADRLAPILRDSRWKHEEHQEELRDEIIKRIRRTELPTWFTKPILDWYHQHRGFIRVGISAKGQEHLDHLSVKGDANVIDSILTLWANQAQIDHRSKEFKLFVRPVLLQHQAQPVSAGTALTQPQRGKQMVVIHSVWGSFVTQHSEIKPDEFVVDMHTEQVVERQLQPQYVQLDPIVDSFKEKPVLHYRQTEPSLTDEQAVELARLVYQTKRMLFEHQQVLWTLENDVFVITDVVSNMPSANTSLKVLLSGQVAQPGIAGGTARLVTSPHDLLSLTLGDILVIHELTSAVSQAFSHVSAVLCDRGIQNPELLTQLKKQHIACLINTHHATQTLRNGQRIVVDANAGKVLQAPMPMTQEALKPISGAPTATKLYISAGNPDKAAEYLNSEVDGVGVLRSEYALARYGMHPLAAIRSNQHSKLQAALHAAINAYHLPNEKSRVIYRSFNMTSTEAKVLGYAQGYEPEEMNPYLGFRGGLKLLSNLDLLNFELKMIRDHLEKYRRPLGYMVSFVRSPSELQLLHNHLKDYRLHQYPQYQFWLQLNTPENLLDIDHYLTVPIDGFSVNIRSIHALLHGVDPDDPEIYSLYPLNLRLFEKLLTNFVQTVRKAPHPLRGTRSQPELVMHLEDSSSDFVALAVKLGFTGVTVKPSFVSTAKHVLRETETARIGH